MRKTLALLVGWLFLTSSAYAGQEIIHDAEHYILLEEHAERWAAEDKRNASRLEELRKKNSSEVTLLGRK